MTEQCQKSFGGKWSDAKLDALGSYLKAYTTALKNTPFKLAYIDAFAGAGTREVGHQQEETWFDASLVTEDAQYRHGSPLIAIQNIPAFDQFYFIEQDLDSIERLKGTSKNHVFARSVSCHNFLLTCYFTRII